MENAYYCVRAKEICEQATIDTITKLNEALENVEESKDNILELDWEKMDNQDNSIRNDLLNRLGQLEKQIKDFLIDLI